MACALRTHLSFAIARCVGGEVGDRRNGVCYSEGALAEEQSVRVSFVAHDGVDCVVPRDEKLWEGIR